MRFTDKLAITLAPHHKVLHSVFYASIAIDAVCFLGYLVKNGDLFGAVTIATPWARDIVHAIEQASNLTDTKRKRWTGDPAFCWFQTGATAPAT